MQEGINLPLGADLSFGREKMAVTIHKDYMLAQTGAHLDGSARSGKTHFSRYSTYDAENDVKQRSKYPVTWVIDQNHEVA